MRIKKLYIHDKSRNLSINPIEFKDLTLLVGVSGVGKTQIIKYIEILKNIANGASVNGLNWEIEFEIEYNSNKNDYYKWSGEFDTKPDYDKFLNSNTIFNNYKILNEVLICNSEKIIERKNTSLIYNNKLIEEVQISQFVSAISILKGKLIDNVYNSFQNIISHNFSEFTFDKKWDVKLKKQIVMNAKTLLKIQQLKDLSIWAKLFLLFRNTPNYKSIELKFINIFPQVKNISLSHEEEYNGYIIAEPLKLKEKGVEKDIDFEKISTGMLRTLLQISEIYLSAKGTVILIDEFENSLGVNCIDALTEDLVTGRNNEIQFIITSHHPYIINNIDSSYWKIVTRKGGEINTIDATDVIDSRSKHKAFMQLINSGKFTSGIEI